MAQSLSWALCNRLGRKLFDIDDRQSGTVTIIRSGRRSAQVVVPLESEVADAVQAFSTTLKVWLDNDLLLAGPVVLPRKNDPVDHIEIAATDPSVGLEGVLIGFAAQTQIDQSEILARIVEHIDTHRYDTARVPSHGIIRGNLRASVKRDRAYLDGKQGWEAMIQLSEVIGGVDFELEPLDREDGIFARLNTFHPRQGTNRTKSAVFEYGHGQHTAEVFAIEPGGGEIVNRVIYAGRPHEGAATADAWVSYQPESQEKFGLYERFAIDADVTQIATLREAAEEIVAARAFPIPFFSFASAPEEGAVPGRDAKSYGVPPKFGPSGDYWIGDEIRVIARYEALDEDLRGRVQTAVVSEDLEGNVYVACSCDPTIVPANVQGFATVVTPVEPVAAIPAEKLPAPNEPGIPGGFDDDPFIPELPVSEPTEEVADKPTDSGKSRKQLRRKLRKKLKRARKRGNKKRVRHLKKRLRNL